MASKRERLNKKIRHRKEKEHQQLFEKIKQHQNNPELQKETINQFMKTDIEKASISELERLDAEYADYIEVLKKNTKQYIRIIEEDEAAYEFIYNSIIQGIYEKVNELKTFKMYQHVEQPKTLNIPDEILNGKEYQLIEKHIKAEQIYAYWIEHYDTPIRETENWCKTQLNILDMNLVNLKEYYGMLTGSQFSKNYSDATKLAGDEINANKALNDIIATEVMVDDNDAIATYNRIKKEFEERKAEVFDNSDKIRKQLAGENKVKTEKHYSKDELYELSKK